MTAPRRARPTISQVINRNVWYPIRMTVHFFVTRSTRGRTDERSLHQLDCQSMFSPPFRGSRALVTGASSGIGEAFAEHLAQRGMGLMLTSLPSDLPRLEHIASTLAARYGTHVQPVAVDLTAVGAAQQLQTMADERGFHPD